MSKHILIVGASRGIGLGLDRLAMVLTGWETIRDVILFPTLRERSTP